MPAFLYRGRAAGGGSVQGVLEGEDPGTIASALARDGVIALEILPAPRPSAPLLALRVRVSIVDLLLFSRQMYALLKAGVPILRALKGLQESSGKGALAGVLQGIRESLENGRELSAALARQGKVFGPYYVAMIQVGETTGRLEEIFLRLYEHLEFQDFMRNQVKSAVRYPSFVVAVMVLAIIVINIMVIPAFSQVYKGLGGNLPVATRILLASSEFMVAYWPWLLAASIAGFFGFRAWAATPSGRYQWDRFKLRIPIAGKIVLKATLSRFARSFALAVRSGVSAVHALSLVARTADNDFISSRIERMREDVERGESLLRAAASAEVFTPVALQMIMVGEESGTLDEMMEEVAELYRRDVEYELKTLSAQIEPILVLLLGAMVLVLALGVFLPIWDLGRVAMGKPPG